MKNTNHDTVIAFLREYINVYGVPEKIKSDKGGAFISKEYKNFCNEYNIIRKYGTPNLHTGTGLVERTIQSLKNLIKANLEDTQNLRESLNEALYVLRFATHTQMKKTPFGQHFGRKPGTKLYNLKNAISVDSKELSVYITRNSAVEITDQLVRSKKKSNDPKSWRGMTFTQNKNPSNMVSKNGNFNYPFTFYEKAHTNSSLECKLDNKPQTAIFSGTKHTITTDKNETIQRKLISNPIPFPDTATPTKRKNTRISTATDNPRARRQPKPKPQPADTAGKSHPGQKMPKIVPTGSTG